MEWSGPANRPGLDNRHGRSHGWSLPITGLTFQVRKVIGGGGWVACKIIVSAPVLVPFLWSLDFGFWTWIWDLDLGLDFGLTINPSINCLQNVGSWPGVAEIAGSQGRSHPR